MTRPLNERVLLIAAFAAVYLIWGSTYLAIKIAIETLPPLLMAAVRFLLAGGVLYAWARARGRPRPSWRQWRAALVIGAFLFLGGNAMVVVAEQVVPSGLASLLVATEPLWVVILLWGFERERPGVPVVGGLLLGLAGVLLLVGPANLGGEPVHALGAAALVFAALSWAGGSLLSRRAPLAPTHGMSVATTMLAGGIWVLLASIAVGEPGRFDPAAVSAGSVAALLYLTVFGSIVAFSAYLWLMKHATPSRASTYAYVNPVVAVFLGWGLGGEAITLRTVVAGLLIVSAVWLIISQVARHVTGEHPAPEPRARSDGGPRQAAQRAA